MSASRRLELLDWAQRSSAWIVEDDWDSEYRYDAKPIAALQGLDRNARVVYTGTFSKVMFPSLRLGYAVVPPDLVERFAAMRRAMDLCPPYLAQAPMADFLSGGHFARHLRRIGEPLILIGFEPAEAVTDDGAAADLVARIAARAVKR